MTATIDSPEITPGPHSFQISEDITLVRHQPEDAVEAYNFYHSNRRHIDQYLGSVAHMSVDGMMATFRKRQEGFEQGKCFDYWIVEAGKKIGDVTSSVGSAGNAEVGYVLTRDARGKGIATQAAQTLIRFLNESRGVERVYLEINPENAPSQRVAERLGAVRKQELEPTVLLSRFKKHKYRKTDVEVWEVDLHGGSDD